MRKVGCLLALIPCALIVLRFIQRKHLINLKLGFFTLLESLSNLTQNLLEDEILFENENFQSDFNSDHLKTSTIFNKLLMMTDFFIPKACHSQITVMIFNSSSRSYAKLKILKRSYLSLSS